MRSIFKRKQALPQAANDFILNFQRIVSQNATNRAGVSVVYRGHNVLTNFKDIILCHKNKFTLNVSYL